METITNIIGGGMVTLLLAVAMPNIIHQACSDDGDFNSGATPECPVWVEAVVQLREHGEWRFRDGLIALISRFEPVKEVAV